MRLFFNHPIQRMTNNQKRLQPHPPKLKMKLVRSSLLEHMSDLELIFNLLARLARSLRFCVSWMHLHHNLHLILPISSFNISTDVSL